MYSKGSFYGQIIIVKIECLDILGSFFFWDSLQHVMFVADKLCKVKSTFPTCLAQTADQVFSFCLSRDRFKAVIYIEITVHRFCSGRSNFYFVFTSCLSQGIIRAAG